MLYLVFTAVPFKALQLGAGPFELGLLGALSTGSYALLALVLGRVSDRLPRTVLARTSCVIVITGCIGLTISSSVGRMLLWIPLIGGGLAPFWPSVQASIGDRSALGDLERNLGAFNLGWSTGKACGFLVGGALVAASGSSTVLTVASAVAFVIFFLLPDSPRSAPDAATGQDAATPTQSETAAELDPRAPLFRRLGWVANGIAFGVGATLNHHYPRLIQEFGWSPRVFGLFLGLVYLTQSLTFLLLARKPGLWRFRRSRLYATQLVMLVAVLTLPFADLGRVLVSALVFGFGLGTCYLSSIYYSLHTHADRGRNVGVHEGLIGMGSMLLPLLGGWAARDSGFLAAPYWVAAAALGIAMLVQEAMFRTARPPAVGAASNTSRRPT